MNPRVHLFFGARYPCELYDLRTLWQIASTNPWLSVSPVSEFSHDPPWAADYPDVQPPRGLHVRQTGTLPEVVTRYGGWGDRQILICGGPAMVPATKDALIAKGAPPERIQHDPLAASRWYAVAGSRADAASSSPSTLRDPSSSLTANYVPDAGMIGTSLTDDGVELLGQRRGLDAYVTAGKTMGIPILYPWANRLSDNTYTARRRDGRR